MVTSFDPAALAPNPSADLYHLTVEGFPASHFVQGAPLDAASGVIPGDTLVFGDDASIYPAIGDGSEVSGMTDKDGKAELELKSGRKVVFPDASKVKGA